MSNEAIKSKTLDKLSGMFGLGVGAATASAVGTTIGSAGVLGSMGSAVGLTVAAATPVGWIIGGAALGGAALYGASKLINAKGYSEGDMATTRQFESEKEQELFNEITLKLSQSINLIAKELVNKLPNSLEYKADFNDGLEKGTMNANEVIQICCEYLNEDYARYKNIEFTTIQNIISFIKIATLLAVIDNDYSNDEKDLIKTKVIDYFSLDKILTEDQISLIFKFSIGTEKEIQELTNLSLESKMNLLHTFVLHEENNILLAELNDFLKELAFVDNNMSESEELLLLFYEDFLLSKQLFLEGIYNKSLLLLKTSEDLFYYSEKNEEKNKSFNKKLKNVIESSKKYGYCIASQNVIALHDSTTFGSGTDGFLFTPLGIFTNYSEAHFIPYFDLENHLNDIKEVIDFELEDYATDFFEGILQINKSLVSEEESTNMQEWHIAYDQKQLGLKSMNEIDELLASKEIQVDDSCMVWQDGMEGWEKIEDVQEFHNMLNKYTQKPIASTPPPLPN